MTETAESIKILIINLQILGRLKKGEKIDSSGRYFIINKIAWYQGLQRMYHSEGRDNTYNNISIMIERLYKWLENPDPHKYLKMNSKKDLYEYLEPILNTIKNSINNLKYTYEDDQTFVAKLDLEISNLDLLLKSIKTLESIPVPIPVPVSVPFQSFHSLPPMNSVQSSVSIPVPQLGLGELMSPKSTTLSYKDSVKDTGLDDEDLQGLSETNDDWM